MEEEKIHTKICYKVEDWLKEKKSCQRTRCELPTGNIRMDVVGGNIKFREISVHCIEVKTDAKQVAEGIGQLHVYKYALKHPELEGGPFIGSPGWACVPDKVFLYLCVPETPELDRVIDLAKENGFGLLIFEKDCIDQILESQEQVKLDEKLGINWVPKLSSNDKASGMAFIREIKKSLFLRRLFTNVEELVY